MLITAAHRRFNHQPPSGVDPPLDMTTWFKFNTVTPGQNDGSNSTGATIGSSVTQVTDNSLVDDDSHSYTAGTPANSNHRIGLSTANFGSSHLDADFTVCFHAKAVQTAVNNTNTWGVGNTANLDNYFMCALGSTTKPTCRWRENAGTTETLSVEKVMTLNEEYHIAITYDASESTLKMFVNGTENTNSLSTANLGVITIDNHQMGMVSRTSGFAIGDKWHMGDLRIYDYILTDDEINAVRDDKKAY